MTTVEIIVEGEGLLDVATIGIEEGSTGREIVAAVAVKGGFPAEEGLLFIEDCEEPLDLNLIVATENIGRVHHVHRARHIEVSVFYRTPADREVVFARDSCTARPRLGGQPSGI